jgi:hypothetical protein
MVIQTGAQEKVLRTGIQSFSIPLNHVLMNHMKLWTPMIWTGKKKTILVSIMEVLLMTRNFLCLLQEGALLLSYPLLIPQEQALRQQ